MKQKSFHQIMNLLLSILALFSQIPTISTQQDLSVLRLIGTGTLYPLDVLPNITIPENQSIRYVRIEKFHIDPVQLLWALKSMDDLEGLDLEYVDWTVPFPANQKLDFANLTFVFIRRLNWDFALSTPEEFLSLIFFNSPKLESIFIGNDMNCYLQLDPLDKRISTKKDPHNMYQYFTYEKLNVWRSSFDVTKFNGIGTKILSLDGISFENGHLRDVLKKCANLTDLHLNLNSKDEVDLHHLPSPQALTHLTLRNCILTRDPLLQPLELNNLISLTIRHCSFFHSKIWPTLKVDTHPTRFVFPFKIHHLRNLHVYGTDMALELTDFRHSFSTLQYLYLGGVILNQTDPVVFTNLEYLYFNNCSFDDSFISLFPTIFSNLQTVAIVWELEDRLLAQILRSNISQLNLWGSLDSPSPMLQEFLISAGAPLHTRNIQLQKSATGKWAYIRGDDFSHYLRDELIHGYFLILVPIAIGGIIGNILSAIVLCRKNMRGSTTCILLCLTLCDTLVLLAHIPDVANLAFRLAFYVVKYTLSNNNYVFFGLVFTYEDMERMNELHRSIFYPLIRTAYTGSVFATVLLTLERYVAVCWSLKAKEIMSIKNSCVASCIALAFAGLLNLPRWFEADSSIAVSAAWGDTRSSLYRIPKVGSMLRYKLYIYYYQGLWVALVYVVPILILIILNLRIGTELAAASARRRRMMATVAASREANVADQDSRSITRMLVMVTIVFLFCSIVNGIIILYFVSYKRHEPVEIESITAICTIINSSVNFIIYTTIGKKFRAEFLSMFQKSPLRKSRR